MIDAAFSRYQPANPGCQLSVSRNGKLIFSKAWGMADMERNVPLTTNSILEAGSVSKQFTAAAILLLEQQGKLSQDDDVRKYIPELPDYGNVIRIRHLLHHTSGIRDWGSISDMTGWPRSRKFYTNEDVLEIIARQKQLNNKPGDEYLYSNSNYNLQTIIVQRVSGLSLAEFTRKYIFEPVGMSHTQWRDDPNRIVPGRAIAYSKQGNNYVTDMPNEYVYGNGGMLTTTEDLLKWDLFFQLNKTFGTAFYNRQVSTDPLNNGVMNNYAAGLFVQKLMGWDNISHSGATAGYRAYKESFPELKLSIAILSNTSQFNINELAAAARKIFVPDRTSSKSKTVIDSKQPAIKTGNFPGLYKNEREGSTFTLSVKDDKVLLDEGLQLVTISEQVVQSDNFLLELKGNKGWYIPFSPRDTMPFIKVTPVQLNQTEFAQYEGTYFSEETNSTFLVRHDENRLVIQLKPGKYYDIVPTYKDAFAINDMSCDLEFTRDALGKISGIKMSIPRARYVVFKKIH
jgi:CubicO group peptidase (beta-lactamase class C family)